MYAINNISAVSLYARHALDTYNSKSVIMYTTIVKTHPWYNDIPTAGTYSIIF